MILYGTIRAPLMAKNSKSDVPVTLSTEQVEQIARALADPRRFHILQQIASQRCAPCADLRDCFPITAATMSHHLKELEAAGLIEMKRRGKFVDSTFRRQTWEAYLSELAKV